MSAHSVVQKPGPVAGSAGNPRLGEREREKREGRVRAKGRRGRGVYRNGAEERGWEGGRRENIHLEGICLQSASYIPEDSSKNNEFTNVHKPN